MFGISGGLHTFGGNNFINPLSIYPYSMKIWIDSSSKCITTSGSTISGVTDLSPANTALSTQAASRPRYAIGNPSSVSNKASFNFGTKPAIYFQQLADDPLHTDVFGIDVVSPFSMVNFSCFFTFSYTDSSLPYGGFDTNYPWLTVVNLSNVGLGFNRNVPGQFSYSVYVPGNGAYSFLDSNATNLNDGKIHTIGVVHNSANGNIFIYVDGKLDATGNIPFYVGNTIMTIIGAFNDFGTIPGFRGGQLAEMIIWDDIITPLHISQLHNRAKILYAGDALFNPLMTASQSCKVWYTSDNVQTAGGIVTGWNDQSGNGQNAIVVGSPTYTSSGSYNNKPMITLNTGNYFTVPNTHGVSAQPFTIVAVVKSSHVAFGTDSYIFSAPGSFGPSLRNISTAISMSDNSGVTTLSGGTTTVLGIFVASFAFGSSAFYQSAYTAIANGSFSSTSLSGSNIYIGDNYNSLGTTYSLKGDILQFLLYSGGSAMGSSEIKYLLNGFSAMYGVILGT